MDAKRFLDLQSRIKEQELKLEENRKKMGHMNITLIKQSRHNAEKTKISIETKLNIGTERINELDQRIKMICSELEDKRYATADSKFSDASVSLAISELTCEDLNKYYKALDYSISSFHKCKMDEINKLLKKFWEIAYQGKDIDYIKILSDEEERSATDKRRTYNYRVVMVKNGKEMDMKGRCSAGQKVLTSLVIRLVLTIIFCHNFPVLALDEPTTNLDRASIQAFARAIISLIRTNHNFQIIIITHDQQFLDCLGSDTGEIYYKIIKNDDGYSTIFEQTYD